MDLIELLKKQERIREDYWKNVDYFLPIRLKWRAQMVRHFFHLFPENSILKVGSGSCQWTREISEANGNRNPICAAILNKELYEENYQGSFPENIERIHLDTFPGKLSGRRYDFIVGYQLFTDENAGMLLSEIKKLLKPGGQILFFDPNPWNPYYRMRRLVSKLFSFFKRKERNEYLNRVDLFTLLSEAGYVKIKILPYDFLFPPLPKILLWPIQNLSLILENFPYVRNFAGSLFTWAQKPAEENWKRPMFSQVRHDCFKGRLSVVVPSRNEEQNITPLIENLQTCYGEYIKEIIIVDDNSRDGTAKVTKVLAEEDPRIRLVQRCMPNGVGHALRDGFAAAEGDFVLTMDCDFQHIIPDLTGLFDAVAKGADVAVGSRFSRESVLLNYAFTKILANRGFHILANLLLGKHFRDATNNLKLMRKQVLKNLVLEADDFAANAETGLQPILLGYNVKEVPISWINRSVDMGFSSFNLLNTGPNYFVVLFRLIFRKWLGKDIVRCPPIKQSVKT
ncbi:MAG: glycosyltransferase [Nitrospina sp.]|nr:glycosyltransferase [Nitrospina sp.]